MKRVTKFKFYLASIHYTGDNIGNDIHIVISTLGQRYTLELKLTNGEQKIFEPLKFIAEGTVDAQKSELRRKVNITVIERDPQRDDEGKSNKFQVIPILSDSQFNFAQSVEVEEDNNLQTKGRTGHFSFSLVALFPSFAPSEKEDRWFPKLSPPILQQSKPQYLSWSCDPVCLRKCIPNDWTCILNCCSNKETNHLTVAS